MGKSFSHFEQICQLEQLMKAWRQVRSNKGIAGIDLMTIAEYEKDLEINLKNLAALLKTSSYFPMPVHSIDIRKANGKTRTIGIFTINDRIVQRATLNVIEPIFEPIFLDCNHGFRPNRSINTAIEKVLDFHSQGNFYVVDADISNFFGSINSHILMKLLRKYIKEKRLLNLINMWVNTGQVLADATSNSTSEKLFDKTTGYISNSINSAITSLMNESNFSGYNYYNSTSAYNESVLTSDIVQEDPHKAARKEAIHRLGRDGVLLLLTYSNQVRRLFSPTALAITGAVAVAAAAYPLASKLIKQYRSKPTLGVVQGSPISPLLSNIYLHEFDLAMTQAGLNLVRYADDWVIMCKDETSAQKAMMLASKKLSELALQLHPDKTRIIPYSQGFQFLGYDFSQPSNTTTNNKPSNQAKEFVQEKLSSLASNTVPAVSKLGKEALNQGLKGANKLISLFKRNKKE